MERVSRLVFETHEPSTETHGLPFACVMENLGHVQFTHYSFSKNADEMGKLKVTENLMKSIICLIMIANRASIRVMPRAKSSFFFIKKNIYTNN
jgi:hypothetical protein